MTRNDAPQQKQVWAQGFPEPHDVIYVLVVGFNGVAPQIVVVVVLCAARLCARGIFPFPTKMKTCTQEH